MIFRERNPGVETVDLIEFDAHPLLMELERGSGRFLRGGFMNVGLALGDRVLLEIGRCCGRH